MGGQQAWTGLDWDRTVAAFDGEADLKKILAALKAAGFDGWIGIEYGGAKIKRVFETACCLRELWPWL